MSAVCPCVCHVRIYATFGTRNFNQNLSSISTFGENRSKKSGTSYEDPRGAHPASCTMGTGSFLGVKRPGRHAYHTPPSRADVMKGYSYTSNHPLGLFRPVTGLNRPALPFFLFKGKQEQSGFGGLVVSMLASGTQVRGVKPGRSRRIFRANKSSACLPSEGK
jgi:hypothetical protein